MYLLLPSAGHLQLPRPVEVIFGGNLPLVHLQRLVSTKLEFKMMLLVKRFDHLFGHIQEVEVLHYHRPGKKVKISFMTLISS